MYWFWRTILGLFGTLKQAQVVIGTVLDGNFQGLSDQARIVTFFVRDQTIEDLGEGPYGAAATATRGDSRCAGCDSWRVQAAAHEYACALGTQAVGHSGIEQFVEAVNVVGRTPEMNRRSDRRVPIAVNG
jgi:hypothetical protein